MEFTEQEVRDKLEDLGYHDVPRSKLLQFMADLEELIQLDLSGGLSSVNEEETTRFEDGSPLSDNIYSEYLKEKEHNNADNLDYSSNTSRLPLQDVSTKVQRKAFAKEKIKQPTHNISEDKENMSLLLYTIHSDSLSSTLMEEQPKQYHASHPDKLRPRSSCTKRKVARKKDGSLRIFDESSLHSDSQLSDITLLEERIRNLPVMNDVSVNNGSVSSTSSSKRRPGSAASTTSLPAFIRPAMAHPHTKKLKKCDPVNRYHEFQKEWTRNKFPGDSKHSTIRWNVREQMLHCEVFEKPRHQYSANDYVVPTEKKRLALRWQVRSALARM